jgi:hypothetical protein
MVVFSDPVKMLSLQFPKTTQLPLAGLRGRAAQAVYL